VPYTPEGIIIIIIIIIIRFYCSVDVVQFSINSHSLLIPFSFSIVSYSNIISGNLTCFDLFMSPATLSRLSTAAEEGSATL